MAKRNVLPILLFGFAALWYATYATPPGTAALFSAAVSLLITRWSDIPLNIRFRLQYWLLAALHVITVLFALQVSVVSICVIGLLPTGDSGCWYAVPVLLLGCGASWWVVPFTYRLQQRMRPHP